MAKPSIKRREPNVNANANLRGLMATGYQLRISWWGSKPMGRVITRTIGQATHV
jgi:hypothetical protein